jgi:hypothetical protein
VLQLAQVLVLQNGEYQVLVLVQKLRSAKAGNGGESGALAESGCQATVLPRREALRSQRAARTAWMTSVVITCAARGRGVTT